MIWTTSAKEELRELVSYIGRHDPLAARRMRDRIRATTDYLKSQPFMGRPGSLPDTREAIPHPSYRIVYGVSDGVITIHAIVHTSRQWPPASDKGGD
ncbi:MAG: type II toxin-antitoxin system RelE/ParE family toxin [Rhizobiaceae bacterium]